MKTVKILKNVEVTLAPIHDEIHVGQHFDKYYTNVDNSITVTKIHKQIETDIYDRKYLVNAIEIK
ncbi:hypothetical protein YN120080_203 [Staphylococcus phage vB_SauM_JDYN]|nr:hypothetical protein YN120080_203 [Staphylococcus phage vB_SauM_JDYN]